jgi:Cu(I)/Ag(I) efflux system membrane fusion protein
MKHSLTLIALVLGAVLLAGCSGGGDAGPSDVELYCPMHPEVVSTEPGVCPICQMDLVPRSTDVEVVDDRTVRMSEEANALAEVETAPVQRKSVDAQIRLVGRVAYDESRVKTISAWIPGRLERMYVDYTGVPVATGDHLFDLYSPDLIVAQQELLQAMDLHDDNAPAVELIREKLRRYGLLDDQIRELEDTGETSSRTTIYAPVGGIVIEKSAKEGMYVKEGSPIYTIADLSRLWLQLEAYETDMPWIRFGQTVTFQVDALPGVELEGRISFVDPVLNPKTRTIGVRVNIDNSKGLLKPDMFARATVHANVSAAGPVMSPDLAGKWISPMHPEIIKDGPGACDVCGMDLVPAEQLYAEIDSAEAPLVIPATAPLLTGKRAIVYVLIPTEMLPTYEGRSVILGPRVGDYYIVESGLKEHERVVVNGAFKIDSELQIAGKMSMMYPEGGGSGGHQHGDPVDGSKPGMDHKSGAAWNEENAAALDTVLSAYLPIHASLAADDAEKTKQLAPALEAAVTALHNEVKVHALFHPAEALADAGDLTGQRNAFKDLSHALIDLVKMHGHRLTDTLQLTECPMAFGPGIAARWLQTGDTLLNPYQGSNMLHCGEFLEPIAPSDPSEDQGMNIRPAVGPVIESYYAVQEALANDDDAAAREQASPLAAAAKELGPHGSAVQAAIDKLLKSTDLPGTRAAFQPLSDALIDLTRNGGHALENPVRVAHCPMAFGHGNGANWLQRGDEIFNPYQGSNMLHCGEVVETIEGANDGK